MNAPERLVLDTIKEWREFKPEVGPDGVALLDMAKVTQLDSAGVALLVQWAAQMHGQQARLQLTNPSDHQRELVTLCGVDTMLL